MPRTKLTYERVTTNDYRVISNTGKKQTEVLVRVVPQGSYEVCDSSSESPEEEGECGASNVTNRE